MSYWYYPGCSLKSNGKPYEESLLAVLRALNVPVRELDDWNCCGATSYMSVDEVQAFSLAARNLALAEHASRQTTEKGLPQLVAETLQRGEVDTTPLHLLHRVFEHHEGGVALDRSLCGGLTVVPALLVGERVEVRGRSAAKAPERGRHPQLAEHRARLARIDRGQARGGVAEDLHEDPAEPHHHQRAELRIAHEARDQLPTSAHHLAHEQGDVAVLGPHEPGELLMAERPPGDSSTLLPDDAEVCACAGVSAGRIRACADLDDARATTRATTGCGGCADVVEELVATPL